MSTVLVLLKCLSPVREKLKKYFSMLEIVISHKNIYIYVVENL